MKKKKKIVIGLSGGLDSTTLLALLLGQGYEVHCCFFDYGSKHNAFEKKASKKVFEYYKKKFSQIYYYYFNLENIFSKVESNLMQTGGDIPYGSHKEAIMKKTIVSGRNLIFSSIMASLSESIGAKEIALGVHSGDHAIYPDCRPDFVNSLNLTIQASTENKVKVYTPFMNYDKIKIIKEGLLYDVPFRLTRTCYKKQELACGKCAACTERLEGFAYFKLKDPILYE